MADNNDQVAVLATKAITGNRTAIERLIDIFHGDIFRMVYCRTHSQMDAEDLTQDVFIRMLKYLPGLKDSTRFKPWLFRIALNRIRDYHRKKKMLTFLGMATGKDDMEQVPAENHNHPVNNLMRQEFWKQFYQLTDILSQKEQEVFLLRFVDHLGIREIAQTLKKNENTVKTHLYRALKKFIRHSALHDLLKGNVS